MSEILSPNIIYQFLSNIFEYSILIFLLFLIVFRKSFSKFVLLLINKIALKKNKNLILVFSSFEKPLRIFPLLIFLYLLTIFFDLNQNLVSLLSDIVNTLVILLICLSLFELISPISIYLVNIKINFLRELSGQLIFLNT